MTNEEYGRFLAANPEVAAPVYWEDENYNQGVPWDDARRFAAWVGGRLPTEAEWEYAARARTTAPYLTGSGSSDLDRFAW